MIVNCDKCSEGFFVNIEERKIKNDIKEKYFQCPFCKRKYHISFDNSKMRLLQNDIEKVTKTLKLKPFNKELQKKAVILMKKHEALAEKLNNEINSK